MNNTQYTIKFFGGPRDGDTTFQRFTPPAKYYISIVETKNLKEFLSSPVHESDCAGEAHYYECEPIGQDVLQYTYKGVVVL